MVCRRGNEGGGDPGLGQYIVAAHDCLMNIATRGADGLDGADNEQCIVELGGATISDVEFGDGVSALPCLLHAALVDADTREHVRARPLHEMQIAGVVNDAGKISVLEIDPHREQVLCAVKMALIGGGDRHR